MSSQIVAGLDIGTTKVCTVIAKVNESNEIDILGVGLVPSKGLRKGVVVNLDSTAASIAASIEKAEIQAGREIKGVYIGISGGHIQGINSKGVVAISEKNRGINETDVRRVIDGATAIVMPVDREVVHVIPQEYIVDDQDGIKDPVGMFAVRLEVVVHIITAAAASVNNIIKSVRKAGFDAKDIVLEPLASSQSVLTDEEKELGVIMIDIGGGTTDYVIFQKGSLKHTGILSIGGNSITNDVSKGLKTTVAKAEEIKIKHGCAVYDFVDFEEEIEIPGYAGRSNLIIRKKDLSAIIQPRLEEIFLLVRQEISKAGKDDFLAAGAVLTGGVSMTPYIIDLASEIMEMPVRFGMPSTVGGLKDIVEAPIYSTAVGLAQYAKNHEPKLGPTNTDDDEKNFTSILDRIKNWFNEFF